MTTGDWGTGGKNVPIKQSQNPTAPVGNIEVAMSSELDRRWMLVLAARTATAKARKTENDAIDAFQREVEKFKNDMVEAAKDLESANVHP